MLDSKRVRLIVKCSCSPTLIIFVHSNNNNTNNNFYSDRPDSSFFRAIKPYKLVNLLTDY